MNYLEVSASAHFAVMALAVLTNWAASALLLSRLRRYHAEFFREVGEPRLFPSLKAPFAQLRSPTFAQPEQLAKLHDPEVLRLVRVVRGSGWLGLAVLCLAILVQFPAAWIISAGCESGQFTSICP